jgi:hypothetical protein
VGSLSTLRQLRDEAERASTAAEAFEDELLQAYAAAFKSMVGLELPDVNMKIVEHDAQHESLCKRSSDEPLVQVWFINYYENSDGDVVDRAFVAESSFDSGKFTIEDVTTENAMLQQRQKDAEEKKERALYEELRAKYENI